MTPDEYVRAEFYHAEERADVQLLETFRDTIPPSSLGGNVQVIAPAQWSIRWRPVNGDDRQELFKSEREARIRYLQLLAQAGISP